MDYGLVHRRRECVANQTSLVLQDVHELIVGFILFCVLFFVFYHCIHHSSVLSRMIDELYPFATCGSKNAYHLRMNLFADFTDHPSLMRLGNPKCSHEVRTRPSKDSDWDEDYSPVPM